ncbi:hypothetical protein BV898_03293 [Hypsibius exemplaris]|uniref:Uncharacterized protein n=1 Tax=Hypsibius exemplaris TaxID=2072580 RepID=A0A1W0X6B2_HYPEX|nr:hypothetical protein BV898_03293 [Hypsibius exemplaris]
MPGRISGDGGKKMAATGRRLVAPIITLEISPPVVIFVRKAWTSRHPIFAERGVTGMRECGAEKGKYGMNVMFDAMMNDLCEFRLDGCNGVDHGKIDEARGAWKGEALNGRRENRNDLAKVGGVFGFR